MSNPHYFIETFGCQMNVADSELVAGMLQQCGYSETRDMTQADIIFMNTCAIRENDFWCVGLYGAKFKK